MKLNRYTFDPLELPNGTTFQYRLSRLGEWCRYDAAALVEAERDARHPAQRELVEALIEAAYCGQLALSLAGYDEDAEKISAALARVRGES